MINNTGYDPQTGEEVEFIHKAGWGIGTGRVLHTKDISSAVKGYIVEIDGDNDGVFLAANLYPVGTINERGLTSEVFIGSGINVKGMNWVAVDERSRMVRGYLKKGEALANKRESRIRKALDGWDKSLQGLKTNIDMKKEELEVLKSAYEKGRSVEDEFSKKIEANRESAEEELRIFHKQYTNQPK